MYRTILCARGDSEKQIDVEIDSQLFDDVYDRRYLYLVLYFLVEAGYYLNLVSVQGISFRQYVRFREYERRVYHLPQTRITQGYADGVVLLTNKDTSSNCVERTRRHRQTIHLETDISIASTSQTMIMPYMMHPHQYLLNGHRELAGLRDLQRRVRVFFSGGVDKTSYSHSISGGKPNRYDTFAFLRSLESVVEVHSAKHFHALTSQDYCNLCLVADRECLYTPDEDWLATLAMTDFFLALPGMIMPMCHNVIEAMGVGTVPILCYPEWFSPSLTDANCFAYSDLDSLKHVVRRALKLKTTEIDRLRGNVIEYYERYLAPQSLRRRLDSLATNSRHNVTLVVNTDQAKYAQRVNIDSAIIRK